MTLLLFTALLACVPKNAAAVPPAVSVVGSERDSYEALSASLRARAAEGNRYELGATLAEYLADGWADPQVRAAAVVLLDELQREEAAELGTIPSPEGVGHSGADPSAPTELEGTGQLPADASDEGAGMDAEPLEDAEGVARDSRAITAIAGDKIQRARTALRAADYSLAIAELDPLRDGPAWSDARPFWEEAVDGFVGVERERVGALFLDSRSLSGQPRRDKLEQVRALLADLIDTYPASSYVEPLTRNLERVERELEGTD